MLSILHELKQQQVISQGDYYFAKLIADKQTTETPEVIRNLATLLAALCSYNYQQGNTCLFLDKALERNPFNLAYRQFERPYLSEIQQKIDFLPVENWQSSLQNNTAFSTEPQQKIAPLVFQFDALYFYRIWQDEYRVADYLQSAVDNSQISSTENMVDRAQIRAILRKYFPTKSETDINWQKVAVATALRQRFCLITGGPGTGKTTTVARLLLALQELHHRTLNIKLVAPTGKAAARLTESINGALNTLQVRENISLDNELIESIPTSAQTLHRLLGTRFFEERTTYHRQNPLQVDVLVVDEASMIDLPLMAKLLQALKPQTKLILLGDQNQLSPVEAGETLGELGQFASQGYSTELAQYLFEVTDCQVSSQPDGHPIRDSLCRLHHSHRFSDSSGIGQLADAINKGKTTLSWQHFDNFNDIEMIDFLKNCASEESSDEEKVSIRACVNLVVESAVEKYQEYLIKLKQLNFARETPSPQQIQAIFASFNQVRFLTALRVGELGVEQLNIQIANKLKQKGLLNFKHERDWYIGKPIMITQNDSHVGLYNGDIGLFLGDGKVWFEQGQAHYKTVLASRVPNYETAFVMTIHKSQGSEFTHTFLVLPTEPNPILSRELVYTGITRAKEKLTVFTTPDIWKSAVKNPVKRQSGLGKLLVEFLQKNSKV
ncbi:exodeoxyribonuclease V subunit alpha [Pasteurella dagmatis]|uniref:RecBCD enzyme subunit RecD n=1 Tax=Pasteurella dagmatis ATCC 43325 TaxID=667128 RepID=C9PR36_9PAST|nr:exodeoxyribonuclease V subunit alpha [Pasteurella dagmatis]EEX49937.1 exodeoxyribonuclease V, alpha subunit [Pasteurella dagmatis ATCC 43325]SNV60695.1 exodeoxyribonuclease V subunit alpha [Pasteurella dagmatis]